MHQTKKGNHVVLRSQGAHRRGQQETVVQFGMHLAASVADKHMLPDLLHGNERKGVGRWRYKGQTRGDSRLPHRRRRI